MKTILAILSLTLASALAQDSPYIYRPYVYEQYGRPSVPLADGIEAWKAERAARDITFQLELMRMQQSQDEHTRILMSPWHR